MFTYIFTKDAETKTIYANSRIEANNILAAQVSNIVEWVLHHTSEL